MSDDTEDKNTDDTEDETPEETAPAPAAQAAPTEPQASDDEPEEAAAPEPATAENTPKPEPSPEDENKPADVVVQADRPAPTVPEIAQDLNKNNLEFQQDVAMGHIQPKTYKSLFEDKSLPGKIGTIFGMLIGGAGSGLTGQPNALLQMMDKQINNDLEAQKASNLGAQNWYRLNQAHELQKAQIGKMGFENAASAATAYNQAAAGDFAAAKLRNLGVDPTNMLATNSARNMMMISMQHMTQDIADKLPPGPAKAAGQAAIDNQIAPAVQAKTAEGNAQTAVKLGTATAIAAKAKGQAKPQGQGGGAINYNQLNDLRDQGRKDTALGGIPKMTEGDYAKAKEEAAAVETNRNIAKEYNDAFTNLNKQVLGGSLNEEDYNAQTAILQTKMAKASVGHFNLAESNKQGGGMFPSWKDLMGAQGKARQDKYNVTMQMLKDNEVTPTLDSYPGIKTPFPKFTSPFASTPQYKTIGGIQVMRGPNNEMLKPGMPGYIAPGSK